MPNEAMDTLREFFLPTDRNGYVPRGLSRSAFVVYVGVIVIALLAPRYAVWSQLATLAQPALYGPSDVAAFVNAARTSVGLPGLADNPKLDAAAAAKVEDMFRLQYFAHTSPDGRRPWSFFSAEGYRYQAAGENLAIDFLTAADAQAAFMASPTHRANILNPLYTELGVGVGQGDFHGRPSIIIAQYFGRPVPVVPTSSEKNTAKKTPASFGKTASDQTSTPPERPVAVLGIEDIKPQSDVLAASSVTDWTKICLYVLMAVVLLPLSLTLVRMRHIPLAVLARTLVLVAVIALVCAAGLPAAPSSQLAAPAEFSDITWTGL